MLEMDNLLRELADDPSDYDRQGGTAIFLRQGKEHTLALSDMPGSGLSVELKEGKALGAESWIPIDTYVQQNILELPLLASQIIRTLERSAEKRPGKFIEGLAVCEVGQNRDKWIAASVDLRDYLLRPEAGNTRLIQLMAPAGQGKTVLLETTAQQFAELYQPQPYPRPILLTVDLLGRYVGTIEDAIAGSLNNTYNFPRLTQRDVILCIRKRWLMLALDGFDELSARIGIREAFLRITELLEQLRESGTVILSARESFFELYQVSAAIRSYLQPRKGSYSTTIVRLSPWTRKQGIDVFSHLQSNKPEEDLDALLATFEYDEEIVLHPFFLTRLADLWMKGERFKQAGGHLDRLARTKYVIETFVQRESREKWVDRDGTPIIPATAHSDMLGCIAEEMWRSGAFALDLDELRAAAEIGLTTLGLPGPQIEMVLERIPTHAALILRDRRYSFLHDRFLHFFIGHRITRLLEEEDVDSVGQVLTSRDMAPNVVDWIAWNWRQKERDAYQLIRFLNRTRNEHRDSAVETNLAFLCARLLDGTVPAKPLQIDSYEFIGEAFAGGVYNDLHFDRCKFWHLDLTKTIFRNCLFKQCHIGDVFLDSETKLENSRFIDTRIASIEFSDRSGVFSPEEIAAVVRQFGATLELSKGREGEAKRIGISEAATRCVELLIKASDKTCDVCVEEMEEVCGDRLAKSIVRLAIEQGIMREVDKAASGPRKRFIRFAGDRKKLLIGQVEVTRDSKIDGFWRRMREKHPDQGR